MSRFFGPVLLVLFSYYTCRLACLFLNRHRYHLIRLSILSEHVWCVNRSGPGFPHGPRQARREPQRGLDPVLGAYIALLQGGSRAADWLRPGLISMNTCMSGCLPVCRIAPFEMTLLTYLLTYLLSSRIIATVSVNCLCGHYSSF